MCTLAVASNRIISLRHEKGQGSFLFTSLLFKKEISCVMFYSSQHDNNFRVNFESHFGDAVCLIVFFSRCILHCKIEFKFKIAVINCVSKEDANLFRWMHKSIYLRLQLQQRQQFERYIFGFYLLFDLNISCINVMNSCFYH